LAFGGTKFNRSGSPNSNNTNPEPSGLSPSERSGGEGGAAGFDA